MNMKKQFLVLLAIPTLNYGCSTMVDPEDGSPPELRLTYTDAQVTNAEFGSGRTSISYASDSPLQARINALGIDEQSGIASVELVITAEVECRAHFGTGTQIQWNSYAEWTVRKDSPENPGEEDFVSSNAIAYLNVERFAREADCFNNPTYGETTEAYVNVLNAHASARVCNNTSDRDSGCVTDGAGFFLTGEQNEEIER